jgi:mannose-6-phosphate isomerase
VLGKTLPPDKPIGESWELFDFPPGVVESSENWVSSEIANGPLAGRSLHWAVGKFGVDLTGSVPLSGQAGQFPILIKFLDAREDLSIQVHPDAAYSSANPEAHFKTEAWYVLQTDPGARLLKGLKPGTTRHDFTAALGRGDVEAVIETISPNESDCFYLPSGTVHALGAGLLVAEVQTPSDTTFRLFDFNRIDSSTGKQRTLHVDQAMQCIDFSGSATEQSSSESTARLITSPYFHIERLHLHLGSVQNLVTASPSVLIVTHGTVDLHARGVRDAVRAARGEVVLIPASLATPSITTGSGASVLQVTFPD